MTSTERQRGHRYTPAVLKHLYLVRHGEVHNPDGIVYADLPGYRFVMFDEHTGEGRESDEYIGRWLRMHPSGRLLIAG